MVPLLGLSLWVWGLIAERLYFFMVNNRQHAISELSSRQAASPSTGPCRNTGDVCNDLAAGFFTQCSGYPGLDERILKHNWLRQQKLIYRGLTLMATLAATAPLLGLFGTVLGMIDTFDILSAFGTGSAKALAGGISEALISTQSGLLVGIPALLMCIFLRQQARRLEGRLSQTSIVLKRNFAP
ncbi:MAG: MotA/TolQ/ExbB proton channel family protein [Desulfobacteraceae bacterium]